MTPPALGRGSSPRSRTSVRHHRGSWWLALPSIVPILLLSVGPLARGIYLSFTDAGSRAGHDSAFIGLANYAAAGGDALFLSVLTTGLVWTLVASVLQVGLSLGLSLLLDQRRRGGSLFRLVVILPWIVPTASMGIMWRLVYDPVNGMLNTALHDLGLDALKQNWLASDAAYGAAMVAVTWGALPLAALILLGSLQGVHQELHEAAALDGAGATATFRHIVWPHIVPGLVLCLSINAILNFSQFSLLYAITVGSGPGAIRLPMMVVYEEAFRFGNFGYAAALGCVLTVILCLPLAALLRYSHRTRVVM